MWRFRARELCVAIEFHEPKPQIQMFFIPLAVACSNIIWGSRIKFTLYSTEHNIMSLTTALSWFTITYLRSQPFVTHETMTRLMPHFLSISCISECTFRCPHAPIDSCLKCLINPVRRGVAFDSLY